MFWGRETVPRRWLMMREECHFNRGGKMISTTLNKIRDCHPCENRWKILMKSLGKTKADDEPMAFITILDILGLDDALWCTRSAPEHANVWRLYAVW